MLLMKKIVFLCVANSARSQIAEGLAKPMLAGLAEVKSAGSEPSGKVNPLAVEVMRESGIDISLHTSKAIDELEEDFLRGLDYVVTLCAEEVCPVLPSKAHKLHWPNPDPAAARGSHEEQLQAFRIARDNIAAKMQDLQQKLQAETSGNKKFA